MPKLGKHFAAFGVYRGDNWFPAFDLLIGVQTWRTIPTAGIDGDGSGLGNDEAACGSALGVIFQHERIRDVAGLIGAGACEGRHDHTMGECDCAELDWGKQNVFVGGIHTATRAWLI